MAHSYSSLDTFETCPRKYKHKYILREREPPGPEAAAGTATHLALEQRLRDKKPLPPEHAQLEHWVAAIEDPAVDIKTELRMNLDRALQPCSQADAWIVAVADILARRHFSAWLGDWKTGKRREKPLQMRIMAALVFQSFPEVEDVSGCNIWLKEGRMGDFHRWHRDALPGLWREILPRIIEVEEAVSRDRFPEKPGPLCGWCPVAACRFNKGMGS